MEKTRLDKSIFPRENPDQRVNQIGNQRLHDCREGSPDDNPNGQVHHVPAGDELF